MTKDEQDALDFSLSEEYYINLFRNGERRAIPFNILEILVNKEGDNMDKMFLAQLKQVNQF
jgi:hypothetical protein